MSYDFINDPEFKAVADWYNKKEAINIEKRASFLERLVRFLSTQEVDGVEWTTKGMNSIYNTYAMSVKKIKITDMESFLDFLLDKENEGFALLAHINDEDDDVDLDEVEHLLVRIEA